MSAWGRQRPFGTEIDRGLAACCVALLPALEALLLPPRGPAGGIGMTGQARAILAVAAAGVARAALFAGRWRSPEGLQRAERSES